MRIYPEYSDILAVENEYVAMFPDPQICTPLLNNGMYFTISIQEIWISYK